MSQYSASSPILGSGLASAADIDRWFADHAAAGASYVGLPPRTPPSAGESIRTWAGAAGINSDIVAAQIADESSYLQSQLVRDKRNPSGYGAENDDSTGSAYDKATTFATLDEGIQATVAHLADYVRGKGPWTAKDPRVQNIISAGWLGVVRVLSDLDGRWAFPGVGYGSEIAARANDLVAHSQDTSGGPMPAQIAGFQWQPADHNHYTTGRTQRIRGGAQHYSDGTSSLAWLTTTSPPDNPVSATFLVKHNPTMDDRGWQLVRIEDTPWTTSQANPYTVSIEYEHDGSEPIPDVAYDVLAQTWVDIAAYLAAHPDLGAIKLDRSDHGIRGHKEWVGDPSKICPDGIDVDRIAARAAELAGGSQPQTPPRPPNVGDPNAEYFDVTDHWLQFGFREYWSASGGLPVFGYPLTEEVQENGQTCQYFERAVFEWHDAAGVLLRRLGAEAAKAAGYSGAGI